MRNWSYDIGERLLIGENNEELALGQTDTHHYHKSGNILKTEGDQIHLSSVTVS